MAMREGATSKTHAVTQENKHGNRMGNITNIHGKSLRLRLVCIMNILLKKNLLEIDEYTLGITILIAYEL
jgi:hypothetical protein